jgi:peptidyl-prolyl cis-trans isomerase SurA
MRVITNTRKLKLVTRKLFFAAVIALSVFTPAVSQEVVLDEIIATVGDQILLRSELDMEFEQLKGQMGTLDSSYRCLLFDDLLSKKLLLYKAQRDSLVISDERIEEELNKRINYFVSLFKSEKALEEYYNKTILEIKSQNRERIKEQMQVQDMRMQVLRNVKVSPTDVKKFFNDIPKDSLPVYGAEVEVGQIVRHPKVTEEEKAFAYRKIKDLRDAIVNDGASFEILAEIHSEDPGSAKQRGELGLMRRGVFVPAFEAAAYRLRPDSISPIIETPFGYHILKLKERKGEMINVRHILIRPKTVKSDLLLQKHFLDSLRFQISADSISFSDAAKKFTDDEESKSSDGFLIDPVTGSPRIPLEELDKSIYYIIEPMKEGDISEATYFTNPEKQLEGYRLVYLRAEIPPHTANLKDDYQKMQVLALQQKQQQELTSWIMKNSKQYNVVINERYRHCQELSHWIK